MPVALLDVGRAYGPPLLRSCYVGCFVGSAGAAEAFLKTHNVNFFQRPSAHSVDILAYGCTDIVFAPYGDYWRQLRKICNVDLHY
ncbi:unnamed protein product [Linum trigynum]|uniref:Cytochrome P450 n=1 Tax=Linum trigynum TaxID=586398 RepID=A0AAV2EX65_9ROSI